MFIGGPRTLIRGTSCHFQKYDMSGFGSPKSKASRFGSWMLPLCLCNYQLAEVMFPFEYSLVSGEGPDKGPNMENCPSRFAHRTNLSFAHALPMALSCMLAYASSATPSSFAHCCDLQAAKHKPCLIDLRLYNLAVSSCRWSQTDLFPLCFATSVDNACPRLQAEQSDFNWGWTGVSLTALCFRDSC